MEVRLYEAAQTGNVECLKKLMEDEKGILDGVIVGGVVEETPLHIAAQFGHVDFVKEILKEKPEFAGVLNWQGLTPVHLASEKGHVEVVRAVLEVNSDVCYVRDGEGRIPLHIAAMKGRLQVLEELVHAKKTAAWVLTKQREPLLHFCAKHNQFEALKKLVELVNDNDFVALKDAEDNSIFHLLMAKRQIEVIKFLLGKTSFDIDAMNVHGSTALDEVEQIGGRFRRKRIRMLLRRNAGKTKAPTPPSSSTLSLKRRSKTQIKTERGGIHSIRDALMVVAILIATVTFQAIMNPPGGVWQDDGTHNVTGTDGRTMDKKVDHFAGQPIMAYKYPKEYKLFRSLNTIGFVASLLLIILLVSGYSFHGKGSQRAWTAVTWTTIAAMMAVYIFAFDTIASDDIKTNTGENTPGTPGAPPPLLGSASPSSGSTIQLPPIVPWVILVVGIAYMSVFFPLLLKVLFHWVKKKHNLPLLGFMKIFGMISKLFHRLPGSKAPCITSPV